MMPGGQGVFPSLTVAEHLRLAGWLHRKDKARVAAATEHVLELFPVLRERLSTSRPATSRAASSRCSRSAWRSSSSRGC